MKENKVIIDIEQLTPEWLTRIFNNNGYLSQGKVSAIISRNSLEHFSFNLHFLELAFSEDAQTDGVSSKIVVRTSIPYSTPSKILNKHEVKFYNLVAESMDEKLIPTCYDATFSEETGHSHIILDDLSKPHIEYGILNYPIPPLKRNCERAIDFLAEFHAFWWDHKRLKELSKFSFTFHNLKENSYNEKEILNWFENEKQTLNRMLNLLGDRISSKRKELFKTVFSLYPQLVYERIKEKNITLINYDASFSNFLYPKDIENEKSKVKLIIWQDWALGVGTIDLAHMIGLYWLPERRDLMEKELVKRYHMAISNFGVKNYSWEDCWYDYRFSALLNLYSVVYWWDYGFNPYPWWNALEIAFLTIEDLNCMELLES